MIPAIARTEPPTAVANTAAVFQRRSRQRTATIAAGQASIVCFVKNAKTHSKPAHARLQSRFKRLDENRSKAASAKRSANVSTCPVLPQNSRSAEEAQSIAPVQA